MAGSALALTRFEVHPDGDSEGHYVRIRCRRRGLRALIRAAFGLDLNVSLDVDKDAVKFKDLRLFEETYRTIPITAVRAVDAGLRRPLWRLVLGVLSLISAVTFFVLGGVGNVLTEAGASITEDEETIIWMIAGSVELVIGVLLLVWYSRGKQLFLEFEYGGTSNRLVIQRSWHTLVSVPRVRDAVTVISGLVVRAHPVPGPDEAEVEVEELPEESVDLRETPQPTPAHA